MKINSHAATAKRDKQIRATSKRPGDTCGFLGETLVVFFAIICLAVLPARAQRFADLRKLNTATVAIKELYVDNVDEGKLVEDAIKGMLQELDPHSTYSTPKEVKQMNEPLQGSFEGIGVQFQILDDTLVVIQPTTNGPAEKAGILPGDRIVTVNDTAIAGVKMSQEDIMRRLRGPKGSKVNVEIVRYGFQEKLPFVIKRAKIPVKSIVAFYMATPNTGYIKIGNFGATTYSEFLDATQSLREQGMQSLVLDLQDNGGGYLQAAVNVAKELLADGDLIVYTEGRKTGRDNYHSPANGSLLGMKVVILVNEYTASAAEIVTGAVQDNDRGLVVGRRTFGKGLVQRPIDLPDGSMIRLTTAHYYTPAGRCIQKPYEKGKQKDYQMDVLNRLKNGELTSADSIHFADSLRYYTLRKHRPVYGGGGIMPDYFIPLDTMKYTPLHRQIAAKQILVQQNLRYIDKHRKQLQKNYPTFEVYRERFEVPDKLIDDVLSEAKKQKVEPKDDAELQQTIPALKANLKALIARDLWDMNEYYALFNQDSEMMTKALEIISDNTFTTFTDDNL